MSTLPSPHGAVQLVGVVSCGDGDYTIEYSGPTLEALRAAGCIDEITLAAFTGTRRRMHIHPEGFIERRRWYGRPLSWRIVWSTSGVHALTLPSVTDALLKSAGPARMRDASPDAEATTVARNRPVGRLQRPMKWTAVGDKLIVLDWMAVRAAAISQREYAST